MKRFIHGESRDQVTLLPECLDDFIGEDNPVRVIDPFVDELDIASLGFDGAAPAATGRPGYSKRAWQIYPKRGRNSVQDQNDCSTAWCVAA
jgi:transposase